MRTVRWALAAPGAIAAWYATFFLGILTHETVEKALCPGEIVSGMCSNAKVQALLSSLVYIFVAISAVAVVTSAVAIAPDHKGPAGWIAFSAGSLVAVVFALLAHAYGEGLSAIAAGLVTVVAINVYVTPGAANRPLTPPN